MNFRHILRYIPALAVLLCVVGSAVAQTPRNVVLPPGTTAMRTLVQNWTEAQADDFYNLPQGSKLLPYKWFLALEQNGNATLFRDSANIRKLGYLPRTADLKNPDGLPIGFTRDDLHLGFTCAACHTQIIVHDSKAYLIDGAPTLADFEQFQRELVASLDDTLNDAAKFKRFADRVLGNTASDPLRDNLRALLTVARDFRKGYNDRSLSKQLDTHPRYGPGRLDAIGAIFNEVSAVAAKLPDNFHPANAPVSYPFLWDTPQHDKVQWNGSVENTVNLFASPIFGTKHIGALGRNAGEVLGVFGNFEVVKDSFLLPKSYPSTVKLENLIDVEESLRDLWSPLWPEDAFGAIDSTLKAQGATLFNQHCVECHQPIERTNESREVEAWLKHSVGTDEMMAKNFLTRQVKTGTFQGQFISVPGVSKFGAQATQADLLVHSVKRVILGGGSNNTSVDTKFPVPFSVSAPAEIFVDGNPLGRRLTGQFQSLELNENKLLLNGRFDPKSSVNQLALKVEKKAFKLSATKQPGVASRFQARDGTAQQVQNVSAEAISGEDHSRLKFAAAVPVGFIYKGRPLNGIWATAPYLHNGSVPNLDELLKKPGERVKKFDVGSREFDVKTVGFKSDVGTGTFTIDTQLPGNGNGGHEYGDKVFSEAERKALIEYMKSL